MTARTEFYSPRPLTEDELRLRCPSIFANTAHPSRSNKFAPIATIEAVRALRQEGFEPFAAKQSLVRTDGTRDARSPWAKHLMRFRHSGAHMVRVGDSVLEIVLTNANNGQSGYHIDAGVFKLACLNGLVVKSKDWGGISIRHTGDPRFMVVEGTYQVIANAKKAMDAPAKWSKMLLSDARRLLFAQEAHKLRFGDDHRITPEQLLIHRRPADEGRDLWSIFNVVQENCVTGGLVGVREPGKRRRGTTRAVGAIDTNMRLNKALWELAEEFA